ncbi:MAG: transglycosylase SLT domain-containing protein [Candidatus Latescibacterota bacterium]|nr:transglycosylase SLT domain-containing protein [Candidatus Latescibacterota bacterium]
MRRQARFAIATTAVCAVVLLPFIVRIALHEPRTTVRERPATDVAELMRRQEFRQAYAQLLEAKPDSLRPWRLALRLAICERAMGQHAVAAGRLAAIDSLPTHLLQYRDLWLSRSREQLGDTTSAVIGYRALLAEGHRAVADSARHYLARLYTKTHQHAEALEMFRQQLRVAPTFKGDLLYRISLSQAALGDEEGSRKTQLKLMADHPSHRLARDVADRLRTRTPREQYVRAVVRYNHGDDRRTIDGLRRLLRRDDVPRKLASDAQYLLGRSYSRSGQRSRSRRTFERLHEQHGRPSALYRLAGLEVTGDADLDAVQTYRRFARLYPNHGLADDALWQAAKAAERHDEFALAGEVYKQLYRTYPASGFSEEARWSVAFTHYCRGEDERALTLFVETARAARQPHIEDQSYFWAGKTARRLGMKDEATQHFSHAAAGFPRSYYASRAVSMGFGSGQLPRPPAALRAAASVPERAEHLRGADHVLRAYALMDLGLADAAEGELRHAERLHRRDTQALRLIHEGYEELRLHDRALRLATQLVSSNDPAQMVTLYPSYYWEQIAEAAREAHVDPYLILSVIRQESFFNSDAVSRVGAVGLMQIMPQTGRKLARSLGVQPFDRKLLFDPNVSIRLGSRFLGDQVRSFERGPAQNLGTALGLAAYNAGPRVTRSWLERFPYEDPDAFVERIPYKETRLYVKKVLKNLAIYRTLNGRSRT